MVEAAADRASTREGPGRARAAVRRVLFSFGVSLINVGGGSSILLGGFALLSGGTTRRAPTVIVTYQIPLSASITARRRSFVAARRAARALRAAGRRNYY